MTALLVDVSQISDLHVVYRMFDAAGRLVYVGMTSDFGRRLLGHADKAWFLAVTTITLERCPSYADAALAEDEAIRTENPLRNEQQISADERARRALARKRKRSADELQLAQARQARAIERQLQAEEDRQHAAEELARMIREQPPRDLLADLDEILGEERVRVSALPHLLRQLAPAHVAYQSLNGRRIWDELKRQGVRVTKKGNVPRLDPADLRRAIGSCGRPTN